jgi:hypothetical protein
MSKWYLASLATLLIGARVAFGQAQESLPADSLPAPEQAPVPETVMTPSPFSSICDGLKSCFFGETGQRNGGVFTADAEYLLWFLANARDTSAVATTSPLGQAGIMVLRNIGDAEHDKRLPSSGGRLTVGYWQVQDNPWIPDGIREVGVEASFFFVGQRSADFRNAANPNLVRPFFDLNNRQESGFIVAAPGLATGGIAAHSQISVWGAELNVGKNLYYKDPGTTWSMDAVAGFRFLSADQQLRIASNSIFNQNLTAFPAFLSFAGNQLQVFDSFTTHNRFYGGQFGVVAKWWPLGCLRMEGGFKLGLGTTTEELTTVGSQLRTLANGTQIPSNGGLLVLPSNMGHFQRNKFTQVPEITFRLATPLMNNVNLSTGFSALYWSRILRPALQIDRSLDITQIPNFPPGASATPTGLAAPGVPFKQSDLWLLGISIGVEVSW